MTIVEVVAKALWQHERDTKQHDEPLFLSWYEPAVRVMISTLRDEYADPVVKQALNFALNEGAQ